MIKPWVLCSYSRCSICFKADGRISNTGSIWAYSNSRQTVMLKHTWFPRLWIPWGLSHVQRWRSWTLCIVYMYNMLKQMCAPWVVLRMQLVIMKYIGEAGWDNPSSRAILCHFSVALVPQLQLWHLQCLVLCSLWATCIHMCCRCYPMSQSCCSSHQNVLVSGWQRWHSAYSHAAVAARLLQVMRVKSMPQQSSCVLYIIIQLQLTPTVHFVSWVHLTTHCVLSRQNCWEVCDPIRWWCVSQKLSKDMCCIIFLLVFLAMNHTMENLFVNFISSCIGPRKMYKRKLLLYTNWHTKNMKFCRLSLKIGLF